MIELVYSSIELRDMTGLPSESIEPDSVRNVLRYIVKKHGKIAGKKAKSGLITINGERIDNLDVMIPDDSIVSFFPFYGGG